MKKPIIKLYSYPTRFSIVEKIEGAGLEFAPGKSVKVSFVLKVGCRRKIKSGTLYWQPACGDGCCSDSLVASYSGMREHYIY